MDSRDRRKIILLIEDNEMDRDIYGGLLWYNGFEVVHAPDGPTGVARAVDGPPDAILLDMTLPGEMSGLEVMDRLRQEGVDAPVIALTARSEEELGAAVRERGAVAYLEKPITPFAVVREVLQVLGRSHSGTDIE